MQPQKERMPAMPGQGFSQALFTDLYELTMAQAYWHAGQNASATFSLFIRTYPPDRAYFVFCGLEDCLAHLEGLRFTDGDIAYLRSTKRFNGRFLDYLAALRFTGRVRAMPEGSLVFAEEPVIEVTAPVIEAQIVETYLLDQVNLQSVLATKASRVVHAARGRTVVDFAARRTHGTEAADRLARVSYIVGFGSTSNVLAGARYGIPTSGTMAHSFVTSFPSEIEAFRAYATSFPDSSTFLVDSYDTIEGVRNAIRVGLEMKSRGHTLRAVRLDSGDLLELSKRARAMLDEAGMREVQVFASGGLDEYEVDALLSAGAPIGGFGVGTKVGVSADAPWSDCAYKLVEYDGQPVLKLSAGKRTLAGPKQVYRYRDTAGMMARDVIARAGEPPPQPGGEPLLREAMRGGKRLEPPPSLQSLRQRFAEEFARLPERHKRLRAPAPYEIGISAELQALQARVTQQVRQKELGE